MMSTEQIQGSFAEESSPTQLKSSLLLPGTRVCSGALATDVLPEGPDKERLLIDLSAPNAAPSPRLWAPSVGSLNSQVTSQQSEPSWEMLNRPGGVSNEQVHCAALDVLSVDGHDSQPDQPLSALLQDLLSDQPEKVDDTDSVSIPEERWVQLFQLMERQHNEKMIEQHEQHNQQIQLLQSQMTSPKLPIRDDRGVQKTDHLVDKPHGPSGCLSLSEVGPPVSSSGVHQCSVRETVLCCFRTQDEAILRSSQPHPGHLSRNCANQVTVSAMTEPHSIFQQIITVEALPCIASSLNDETEFDSSQQCRNLQLCVQKQTDKQGGPVEPQGEPTEIGNDISSASEEDIGIKGTLSLDDCTVYCSAASTLKPLEMHAATESLNGTSEFAAVILTSADREEVTSQGSSPELMTVTSNEQELKPIACGSANDNTAVVQGLQEQLISASSDTSTEGKADLPLIGSEKEAASSAAVLTVHTSASQTEGEQDDNGPMENAIHLASLLGVVGSCNVLDPEGGCGNTSGETCSLEEGNPLRVTSHVYNGSCNEVVTFSQEILNQCRPFTSWSERQKQRRSKDLQADTENVASLEGKVMPSEKHLQSDHGNDVEPTEVTTPKEAWQPGIPDGPFVSSYTDKSNSPSRTVSLDSLCHNESDDCPEPAGSIVHEGKSSDLPTTSCAQANQCPNSAVQTFSMSSLPSQISSSPTPSLHASLSLSGPQIPAHLPSLQLATPASSTSLPPQQGGSLSLNCSLRDLFHGRRTQSLKENSCDIEGFWLGAAAHPPLQVRPIENPQQVKQQGNLSNSLFYTSPSQHGHFVPLVGNMSRLSCPSRSESSVLGSSASVVGVSANHREVIEEELQLSHPVFIHPGQEGSNYACSLDDSEATATTLESCDPVQLSRLRVFLREKHTRHLSDVRAYYEAELAALTKQLAHRDASSSHRDTALTVTGLSERCKEAEKALHSATLRIHDLESRNRDLERELGAWPERYDTAVQATHMMQRTLEEVRTRCEREEHAAKALRTRVREVERAYNDLYHSADNREERSHRERRMLQDLLAEYETLTKENAHMKETLRSTENRLIDANDETAELKRLNSRLEVQIKQIEHGRNLTHARGSDGISDLLHISISPSHRDGKASTNCSPRHVSSNRRKWLTSPQEVPFATPNHQVEARMHSPPEKDGGSRSCDSPRSGSPDLGPVLRACQDLRDAEQTSSVANRSPGTHKHRSSKNSQGKSRPEHDGSCGEVNEEGRRHPSPITTPLSSWPTRRSSSVPPADRCQPAVLGKQTASISASPRKDSHAAQQRDAVLPGYGQFHKKEEGQSTSLEPVARLSNKKRLNLALNPSASAPSSPPLSGQGNSLQGRAHVNGSARGGTPPKQSQWDTGSSSRASWGSVRPVALTAPYETEFSVQERRQTLGQLDRRLDELTLEKGQIESALSRIPTAAGRATRQVRMDQEVLEERLDEVNRELGSVRMTLKRFHILRTSSHP